MAKKVRALYQHSTGLGDEDLDGLVNQDVDVEEMEAQTLVDLLSSLEG